MSQLIFRKFSLLTFAIVWSIGLFMTTHSQAANEIPQRHIPSPMVGVTIDSIASLPFIVQSLESLSRRPTARIVFDEDVPAWQYVKAVDRIHNVSYVMGELLDSFYVKGYSVDEYLNRTKDYLDTLGSKVDIWEIGNEINGHWLGDTPSVVAKMTGSYDMVSERGGKTALTLYYDHNEEFHNRNGDTVLAWARTNVPERMKQGLDYVFISYYDDSHTGGVKADLPEVFKRLAVIFPNSKIGFGEVGTDVNKQKTAFIDRYYNMNIAQENFVGGYFWWYFKQDMVPRSKPLWKTLNNAIAPKQISGL